MKELRLKPDVARFWCSSLFSLAETIAKEKGWEEATDVCIRVVRKRLKEEAKKVVENQKIESKDALSTKRIFEALTQSPLTGWKLEEAEVTTDRMVLHQVGSCPMWEAAKELGIQNSLYPYRICETGCTGAVQAVNPDFIVIIEKAICKANEYCDFTIEKIQPISGRD